MPAAARTRRWLAGHLADAQVRRANQEGWRSRAAAKLLELDRRDHLLQPGLAVIDLGAAPGGWSQVAAARAVGQRQQSRVVAVDLLPLEPLPGVRTVLGDFTDSAVMATAVSLLGQSAQLLLCDAAPKISGIRVSDEAACARLHEAVFAFASKQRSATVVVKSFTGEALQTVLALARQSYRAVAVRCLQASKKGSRELYVVAKRLIAS